MIFLFVCCGIYMCKVDNKFNDVLGYVFKLFFMMLDYNLYWLLNKIKLYNSLILMYDVEFM